ncbi:MAG: cell division protein FtsW [Lentisphaeria bacterium]|nr:cell division protein FtsW [Lentisphaeria bacterium]
MNIKQNIYPADDLTRVLEDSDDSRKTVNYARWLLLTVVLLTTIGLTMLYSASYGTAGLKFFRNQLIWVILGTCGGMTAFLFGYRRVASKAVGWIILSTVLLIVARFCFPPINGAYRWIQLKIPGFSFSIQPSEFAKIAVALFCAKYCSDNFRTFNELKSSRGILPLAGWAGLAIGGILLGEDLGTTVLVGTMAVATALAAGMKLRYLAPPGFLAVLIGLYVYFFNPTRLDRVRSFMNPEVMRSEEGYQLWNSLMALGSGGWLGIGFMESRLKASYLPEAHTDFILSVIGEELGFLMLVFIILLYGVFTYCGYKISAMSNTRLGMFLGFALTLGISLQAVINIAVVSGSAPTKGMPAPFISYGGSNMIASLTAVGLLASVAAETFSPGYSDYYVQIFRKYLPFLFRKSRQQEGKQ